MITFSVPLDITVADTELFPDQLRCELHRGTLCIMPPPIRWHTRVSRCVADVLGRAGMAARQGVRVRFGDDDMREPDVAVFKETPRLERAFFAPRDFAIVVEVVSKASKDQDRILKPLHYAGAGIPEYWRVERAADDIDDAHIHQHVLSQDAVYVETKVVRLSELEASLTPR